MNNGVIPAAIGETDEAGEAAITVVCVNCRRVRRRGYVWMIGEFATEEEYKIYGRVICPNCRPSKCT